MVRESLRASHCLEGSVELEAGQALTAHRLPQLEKAACLNLPNALARDSIASSHFVESSRPSITQTKTQLDHLTLTRRQRSQHFEDPLSKQMVVDCLSRIGGIWIAQKIFQSAVAIISQDFVQANRMPAHLP